VYLASVDGSYSLAQSLYALDYSPVALSEAFADFNARAPQAPLYVEDFPHLQTPLVQRELSAGIEQVILGKVLQDATLEKRARFSSLGVPGTAAWLMAPPDKSKYHWMHPKAFLCYLQYRMGLPVYIDGARCPMCLEPMDIMGHHALKCRRGWDHCWHHNTLRDRFAEYAHKGSLVAKVEALGLTDGNSQLADVYLPSLPGGPACLNFTVICASQAFCQGW